MTKHGSFSDSSMIYVIKIYGGEQFLIFNAIIKDCLNIELNHLANGIKTNS